MEVGEQVASALIEVAESDAGREMLAAISINAFEEAEEREYEGLATLLHGCGVTEYCWQKRRLRR